MRPLRFAFTALLAAVLAVATIVSWTIGLTAPKKAGLAGLALWLALDVVAALRPRGRAARLYLGGLATLVSTELLLQLCGAAGWIPALNLVHHLPYGRVYWTREGFGNSVMNRHGWYYPEPDLAAGKPRIALIGDSFIEALQIHPSQHLGRHLERGLEGRATVLAFGVYAFGPAHYLELLRYARDRFQPTEAIVFVCLANDFENLLPATQKNDPADYLYDGQPASQAVREGLRRRLAFNHRPLWQVLPYTVGSHALLFWVPETIARRARGAAPPGPAEPEVRADLPDETFEVMARLLRAYRDLGQAAGIRLTLVSIPYFPPSFYERPWAGDPLRLERALGTLAGQAGLPLLAMGEALRAGGMPPEQIRELYLWKGSGHFSPAGHALFGRRVAAYLRARGN